ncbi:MAG: delta-60 repeat domain-containing protein [Gammaproteobacteria bacterium]
MSIALCKRAGRFWLAGALLTAVQPAVWAGAGDLDAKFGKQGIAAASLPGKQLAANAVTVQPDGKLLVVGRQRSTSGASDWLLMRFNRNGSRDKSFGLNGAVATDFGSDDEQALAVNVSADGKILVSGSSILDSSIGEFGRYVAARYNADGSLDKTFGSGGKVTIRFPDTDYAYPSGLLTLPSGQIVLAGMIHYRQPDDSSADPDADVMLVKLNQNGGRVKSFGQDGLAYALFGLALEVVTDAVLQADGKILVAGFQDQGDKIAGFVARFLPDGQVDTDFGDFGIVYTRFAQAKAQINALAVQPDDGKIVAAGTLGGNQSARCFVTRYTRNGSRDATFGDHGTTLLAAGRNETCRDLALYNGKVLLAGKSGEAPMRMTVNRLKASGAIDGKFLVYGRRPISFGANTQSTGTALAVVGNRAVVAGNVTSAAGDEALALAKVKLLNFQAPGEPDRFRFPIKKNALPSSVVQSATVVITGLTEPAAINVENGEYSIGCVPSAFTKAKGVILDQQTVCVRHKSAASSGAITDTVLTVNGVSALFSSVVR